MFDIAAYLGHARSLTPAEIQLRQAFMAWLPATIVDAHAHANLPEHAGELPERALHHMYSTFPGFSLADSAELSQTFFPGKLVKTLRFANAFRGIDHRAANAYLLEQSPPDDRVALYGLPDDVGYTREHLCHLRTAALKMYYAYTEPPADHIYQVFPPAILQTAQELDIPIILHLPRRITECRGDLEQLVKDFPDLRIVLAHLGLTKFVIPGLAEAYAEAASYPNVYLDTAMVPTADVVSLALRTFGASRIMFGTDQPLCLIRAEAYEHPTLGQRIMTTFPYHWVDPLEQREYGHLAANAVHALWSQLGAIRGAIEQLPTADQAKAKDRIFFENAASVFGF